MKLYKKYVFLIQFIKIFNNFDDRDDLVDISQDDYELLRQFRLALDIYTDKLNNLAIKVNKKYVYFIKFIKMFNKFNDINVLVDISQDDYNLLKEFANDLIINYYEVDQNDDQSNTEIIQGAQGPQGVQGPQGEQGVQGAPGSFDQSVLTNYATKEYVNNTISELINNDSIQVPGNVVTSNVEGLKINVTNVAPNNPDENTIYVIQ